MIDGIKILDLSVSADALMRCPSLDFQGNYSQTTGEVKSDRLRAYNRGLTFTLTPRQNGTGYRVEVNGSIHRYHRNGLHNADDFPAHDLLAAITELVSTYAIDPLGSRLNNVEFGVNIVLPFPVSRVLKNLVAYKGKPFTRDTRSDTPYYQCVLQQYVVKLYDKGKQYALPDNVLRVEVKVLKMEYLKGRSVNLNTLFDLLTVGNYSKLGALLVATFMDILFDEPTINPASLNTKERNTYQNGRNPKFWELADELPPTARNTHRKRLQRAETTYRALVAKHRKGADWQSQTAALIASKWEQLTAVNNGLLTSINDVRMTWENNEKTMRNGPVTCPLLTDSLPGELSTFNPLYLGAIKDTHHPPTTARNHSHQQINNSIVIRYRQATEQAIDKEMFRQTTPIQCLTTGVPIHQPRPRQRFVSATMLRHDRATLAELTGRFRTYAKGSKEDQPTRTAHNARNIDSNARHSLNRRINRIYKQPTLFDVTSLLRLPRQR